MTPSLPTNYDTLFALALVVAATLLISIPLILVLILSELKRTKRSLLVRR